MWFTSYRKKKKIMGTFLLQIIKVLHEFKCVYPLIVPTLQIIITAFHQKIPSDLTWYHCNMHCASLIITARGHLEFQLRIKNYTTRVVTHWKSIKSLNALLFSFLLSTLGIKHKISLQTHSSVWKRRYVFFMLPIKQPAVTHQPHRNTINANTLKYKERILCAKIICSPHFRCIYSDQERPPQEEANGKKS